MPSVWRPEPVRSPVAAYDATMNKRTTGLSGALSAVRHSVVDGGAAAVRRYQWERIAALLPPEFDEAWRATSGVPGWFEERQAGAFTLALQAVRRDPTVVEIGSYLGRSAVFQAQILERLDRGGRITAIDPHTGDRQHLEHLGIDELPTWDLFRYFVTSLDPGDRVTTVRATSMEAVKDWSGDIDLLYVDGWHSYDAVREDGESWLPFLRPDGIVVFDDYAKYDEVGRAIDELAEAGLFVPWGVNAKQMIGGKTATAPEPLASLLAVVDNKAMHALTSVKRRVTAG